MNKLILSFFLTVLSVFQLSAQVYNPVKWTFDYKLDGAEHAILQFNAKIEKGWHVYSTTIEDGIGPVPTLIDFKGLEGATLEGGIIEPKPHKEFDPNFQMELLWFEGQATLKQRVKLTKPFAKVSGELTYMTCDDTKCLPPEYLDFEFNMEAAIKPAAKPMAAESEKTVKTEKPVLATPVESIEEQPTEEPAAKTTAEGILKPVKWKFESEKLANGNFKIKAIASIDKDWHVYSIHLPKDDGPVASELNMLSGDYELVGETKETGELHKEYDPNFMMELSFFSDKVIIEREIKATSDKPITGEIYFMCCDAEMCLPPEGIEFSLDPTTGVISGSSEIEVITPEKTEKSITKSKDEKESSSLLSIFLLSFLGGFAALLTPCVFPMIPMTVSFFTKQSKTKAKGISNAIIYGLFIIFIYTILGFLVTITFGSDAMNALATNAWFNIAFFVLLVVFAISFLGAFEITLPSSFVNKVDQASDKGGYIGIFFMAFTLVLVSFSCTGPIIGTLLVEAAVHGGVVGPLIGMASFSFALALPFTLFAAFPGWLNSLPKSGGWLNSVKVVLGFLEIGLAFKFLSNADLVMQAGYLPREVFISIWIAVSAMLTLYLLGFIKMPHDSPLEHLSVGRTLLATVFLTFTIYLIPGLWGAPLKLISGFPPPMFYSESPGGVGGSNEIAMTHSLGENEGIPEGAAPGHCPLNLNCFHDYELGMAYAKKVNKPVILDFTGWACVNCRKMEEQVWSDPRVLRILNDEVVLISLYVDEKTPLKESEQYVSLETGKKVKTIGNKWADFQIKHFNTNAQPQYIIVGHDNLQPLNGTAAYDPDIEAYIEWLNEGIGEFKK